MQITKQLPANFQTHNINVLAKQISPSSLPTNDNGYQKLFPSTPDTHILLINPMSAFTTCPNDCFRFRVQAKLVSTNSGNAIWTSTILLPPKSSAFADFSGVAKDFSGAIYSQLKKDGVLN